MLDVGLDRESARDKSPGTLGQQIAQSLSLETIGPRLSDPRGNLLVETLHELGHARRGLVPEELGAHEAHAAVDVVANAAR